MLLGKGRAATRVNASGKVVLTSEAAKSESKHGPVILCRPLTDPDDFEGMVVSEGILTAKGGALSHAAIVSIELEKACIVGAGFEIKGDALYFADGETVKVGETITLNGKTGEITRG